MISCYQRSGGVRFESDGAKVVTCGDAHVGIERSGEAAKERDSGLGAALLPPGTASTSPSSWQPRSRNMAPPQFQADRTGHFRSQCATSPRRVTSPIAYGRREIRPRL